MQNKGGFVHSFSAFSLKKGLVMLILVPFTPSELALSTPALSSFLSALTITELVMEYLAAILLAMKVPSLPWNSQRILAIAPLSEKDKASIATSTADLKAFSLSAARFMSVSYTHLRAHETGRNLVCRLLLEKKKEAKTE